jgi:AcrR family transcriptional regulator
MVIDRPASTGTRRRGSRAAAQEEMRSRIRDAAGRCFHKLGVEATRMEDVANEVGIARPNLYRYYPTKDLLVQQVLLEEVRVVHRSRLERLVLKGPVGPILVEAIVSGFEEARQDEVLSSMMASDAVPCTAAQMGASRAFQAVEAEFWGPLLEYGRERNEIRDELINSDIVRWVSFVQFLFFERSEFFHSVDSVRHYSKHFVVPSLINHGD